MNSNFTIKNFRAFNNIGADIEIRPITILTGCNSSGKSSFVKALLLLNELFRKNDSDNVLKNSKLDFTSETLSILGDFSTVHNDEAAKLGEDIEISYDVVSSILLGKYKVSMSFCPTANDRLNNGRLKDLIIRDDQSNLIWGVRISEKTETGISVLKNKFYALYSVVYLLHALKSMQCERDIMGTKSEDDVIAFVNNDMMPTLRKIKERFGKDIIYEAIDIYANDSFPASDIPEWMSKHLECFDESMEHNILTYIPEISVLNKFPKETFSKDFMEFCENKDLECITDEDKYLIIEAFLRSDSATFMEFYERLENEFIDSLYNPIDPPTTQSLDFLRKDEFSMFSPMFGHMRTPHFWQESTEVPLFKLGEDNISAADTSTSDINKYCSLFELTYFLLVQLSKANLSQKDFSRYVRIVDNNFSDASRYQSHVYQRFHEYIKSGLIEILSKNICDDIRYVGSSRINIKRLYTLDNSDDFTRTLAEYFEAIRTFKSHSVLKYEPDTFMNEWLRKFGIGYKIEINPIGPGLGAMPIIYNDVDDAKGRSLADYGYGISQLISVLIEIETTILKGEVIYVRDVLDREGGKLNINGFFGYSRYKYKSRTIAIEEPEIHLHPKYQSLLADMFLDAYTNYGISFIIETHSEYLVRRLQTFVARKQIDKELISLTYVESDNISDRKARRIHIKDDGCLTESFGVGFFDEADNLAMSLLMIKGGLA